MSVLLAFRRTLLLGLLVGAVLSGCGGDENNDPPLINASLIAVNFQSFGVGTCNSDTTDPAVCEGGETCDSCPDDCEDPECVGTEQFQVIFLNNGDGVLDITNMEVRGDAHCALTPGPEFDRPLPVHLRHQETVFLNLNYVPGGDLGGTAGTKDEISIAITSNSAEFPLLELLVCGCVVDDPDAAPPCTCDLAAVGDVNCGG
jgi:hypothetical protein